MINGKQLDQFRWFPAVVVVVLIVVQITIARKHATKCGAATAVVLLPYPFGLHADTREARWPSHLVCNCLMRKLFAPPLRNK